jgi:hypothetical protein
MKAKIDPGRGLDAEHRLLKISNRLSTLTAPEYESRITLVLADSLEDSYCFRCQRYSVLQAILRTLRWYDPATSIKIKFGPSQPANFTAPGSGKESKPEDRAYVAWFPVEDLPDGCNFSLSETTFPLT